MRQIVIIHILTFLCLNVFGQGLIFKIKEANKSFEIPENIYSVNEINYVSIESDIEPFDIIFTIGNEDVKFKITGSAFIDHSQNTTTRVLRRNSVQELVDSTITHYDSSFHKINESTYDINGKHTIINHFDDLGRVSKIEELNAKYEKEKRSLTCEYYDDTNLIKIIDSRLGIPTVITSTEKDSVIHYTFNTSLPDYLRPKVNQVDDMNDIPRMRATLIVDSLLNKHFYFITDSHEIQSVKFDSYYMHDSLDNLRTKKRNKGDRLIEHIEFNYKAELLQLETNHILDDVIHFGYNEFGLLISKKGKLASTTYEYDEKGTVVRVLETSKYGKTSIVNRIVTYK